MEWRIRKVHCFFEQSGTFKNEFKKLGIDAFDYDVQNNFGETDCTDDLFQAIEDAYDGKPSLFDNISKDDLIMAFFPCIHFCQFSCINLKATLPKYKGYEPRRLYEHIMKNHTDRDIFYKLLCKFFCVVKERGLKMIFENPVNNSYLNMNFERPTIVDNNRMMRGDYFMKPTGYWFVNLEPTSLFTRQNDKKQKLIDNNCNKKRKSGIVLEYAHSSSQTGLCSEERSMISPDYARNFICDFILGKKQKNTIPTLFDNYGVEED